MNEIDVDFEKIHVQEPNTLVIVMTDGKEITKQWAHKSRSEGWSDLCGKRQGKNSLTIWRGRKRSVTVSKNSNRYSTKD